MLAVNEPERRLILKDSGINFVVNCKNVLLNFSEVTTLKEILYFINRTFFKFHKTYE